MWTIIAKNGDHWLANRIIGLSFFHSAIFIVNSSHQFDLYLFIKKLHVFSRKIVKLIGEVPTSICILPIIQSNTILNNLQVPYIKNKLNNDRKQ